jgi:hypothetical protein
MCVTIAELESLIQTKDVVVVPKQNYGANHVTTLSFLKPGRPKKEKKIYFLSNSRETKKNYFYNLLPSQHKYIKNEKKARCCHQAIVF